MIAINELTFGCIQEVQSCKKFVTDHWLTAPAEVRAWKDPHLSWSLDLIMQHLASFATHYLPTIEVKIQEAKQQGLAPQEHFHPDPELEEFFGRLSFEGLDEMAQLGHFNQIELNVAAGYALEKANFIAVQDELLRLIKMAEAVDMEKVFIPSLVQPNHNFRLADCFIFLIRHQILHFAQGDLLMGMYNDQHGLVEQ